MFCELPCERPIAVDLFQMSRVKRLEQTLSFCGYGNDAALSSR